MSHRALLAATRHRPWPLPTTPWILFQSWRSLLFAHWPVPVARLRSLVPPQLSIDTFEGTGWVALTPFRLVGLSLRGVQPWLIPPLDFPEMNFRTYVRSGARSGIFFFSLDASSAWAVKGARALYRLPYRHAEMEVQASGGEWIQYRSRRTEKEKGAEFVGRYRPVGEPFEPRPGTLEHFLAERYALFTVLRSGRVLRADVHHLPWRLQRAEAEFERDTVPEAHGLHVPLRPPLLHYAARQDTLVWPPASEEEPVRAPQPVRFQRAPSL